MPDQSTKRVTPPLKSYAEVQSFMTQVLTDNQEMAGIAGAPHKAFWNTLPYNDFVMGNVPNVTDPGGQPVPILVKGESARSNLLLALRGEGPLFDPNTGAFGQMPANGPPMFTAEQVKAIADWIDAGCPQ
jgi:hypothetical protein